ncbi:AbrB/MazE/SpoVT family DNA-binding domain-containing protein [Kibdelosporangium lantanae]|uniref:AbrB/MazE/SpoVT family DNA-binding domain-containing protein n=1 Tax=Kibdelosporangium lantanae TaxID=1497396 RepID=A0ABW3M5V3_9PSEU
MSEQITFEAVPVVTDRGHVRLPLPIDPRTVWGRRKRHYVVGQIAGYPFSGSVGFQGGSAFLVLPKDFRVHAGIRPGQPVTARLTEDSKT